MLLFIRGVDYIENLCDVISEYPRVIFVSYKVEVDSCEPVVVHRHAIWVFDPFAPKDGDLQIHSIVEFPDFFYEPIVGDLFPCCVIGFCSNAAVLGRALLVFCFGIKRVPINIIRLL